MQERETPEEQTEATESNSEGPSLKGKAPFLVFAFLALSLSLIFLGLLLFGPSNRLPTGKPAPGPALSSREADLALDREIRREIPFEEHLAGDGENEDLGVVPEVRGMIVPPYGNAGGLSSLAPEPESPGAAAPEIETRSQAPRQADGQAAAPTGSVRAGTETASGKAESASMAAARLPLLAVVIDDLGDSPAFARSLLELGFPVTLAVLPFRPKSRAVAEEAVKAGAEVLLHQPMEPVAYPKTSPGQGALMVGMAPERIKAVIEENLAQTPGADGINNHMGSRFTQNRPGMVAAMRVLKDKGLFFLDSVTINQSVAGSAAAEVGTVFRRRYVFLDNARNVAAILRQLKTAEDIAKKTGRAVAIGHPYQETLEALRLWRTARDPGVAMVSLRRVPAEVD